MNNVNRTLYIPLYGKAYVSRKGILLDDPWAEEIWEKEGFALKGKARSKWLAYYMAMRACVFDRWVKGQMEQDPDCVIVHIGCGMDSRILRAGDETHLWFDLDFPEVIAERSRYFSQRDTYRMIGCDVTDPAWLEQVPKGHGVILMEGVSMYLPLQELQRTLGMICGHFERVSLLMDCYTTFAARASKVKNPVNEVGVNQVYGFDDPKTLETAGLQFVAQREMTPADLIGQLSGLERAVFSRLFAGSFTGKLYRLYEYAQRQPGLEI